MRPAPPVVGGAGLTATGDGRRAAEVNIGTKGLVS